MSTTPPISAGSSKYKLADGDGRDAPAIVLLPVADDLRMAMNGAIRSA